MLEEHDVGAAADHERGASRGEGREEADAEGLNLIPRLL